MKEFMVIWSYYGLRGAEQGVLRIEAESPEAAEEEFYRYNKPAWKDDWNIGYVVEGVEEVSE